MTVVQVKSEHEMLFDWFGVAGAIENGHRLAPASVRDSLIEADDRSVLTRTAWIDGLGILTKTATVFGANHARDLPTVNGAVSLFDDQTGVCIADIDFAILTAWKTAGDSFLAARRLAPEKVDSVLLVGAGPMAAALGRAYRDLFPDAQISVTARTAESAERFADTRPGVTVARNLPVAARAADLISVATSSTTPVIEGAWLRGGQHIDLVGAFRPDMREADDDVIRNGTLFVDSRATTMDQIGELADPLRRGVIGAEDVTADFYDLESGRFSRTSEEEITVFKNGGGAHLDLMVARYFLDRIRDGFPNLSSQRLAAG